MTLEEAAEEILKGAFTTCARCSGDGTVFVGLSHLQFIHDEVSRTGRVCRSCGGTGKWRRGDYLMACCILGIEPAELPLRRTPFIDPGEFNKLLAQVDDSNRFKKEYYMGVWEKLADTRSDTLDATAYVMKHTPSMKSPITTEPRQFDPKRFKL